MNHGSSLAAAFRRVCLWNDALTSQPLLFFVCADGDGSLLCSFLMYKAI